MYLVYSFLLTVGFLILLPRFLLDAFRHGKYVAGFRERLGSLHPLANNGRPVVWIHCVSVGETQAARPLVEGIRKRFPNHLLVISTITLTGQTLARELFKTDATKIFYFPFDWRRTVRRTLGIIQPSVVLLVETELWPGFLRECQAREIPLAIVNGRLSQRSFRRYKLIKAFTSRILRSVDLAIMQTEADAERIRGLGIEPNKVFISGNLKFDAVAIPAATSLTDEFRRRFNLLDLTPLILAVSTHAPEERIMLEAFKRARSESAIAPRLILAPRHPERFAEVAALLENSGLSWARRTAPCDARDRNCDAILLDTIGELRALYPLAAIVFVGGSIAKTGGHNILEPAAVGACIVTGAYTNNFEAIVNAFEKAGAIIQLPPLSNEEARTELFHLFTTLIADAQRRRDLGRRARRLVEQNLGASERTLYLLDSLLSTPLINSTPLPPLLARPAHTA
jgi:3-deoxy-D-manno-octulosonic-acid transferase